MKHKGLQSDFFKPKSLPANKSNSFPNRKHRSSVNVISETKHNTLGCDEPVKHRSASPSRASSPGPSPSQGSSPGARRVTICEVVRRYSRSTSGLHDREDSGYMTPSLTKKQSKESCSEASSSSSQNSPENITSTATRKISSNNNILGSGNYGVKDYLSPSEFLNTKTGSRFNVRNYSSFRKSSGLRKLADSIKIEISPPEEETENTINGMQNETGNVINGMKNETGNEVNRMENGSLQTSSSESCNLQDEEKKEILDLPKLTKIRKKGISSFGASDSTSDLNNSRFCVVKVESCDAGRKNIAATTHLKSFDNPEGKGYLEDSPGSSIRAGGSDSDLDSDRENEKFTSLKRTYSRSSLASAITDFRDKLKGSLNGDLKKVQADNNTKLKIAVLFFFSICFGIVVTSHVLYNQQVGEVQIFPDIKLLEAERRILMKISDHDVASDLGVYIPYNLDPYDCLPGVHHNETKDEKCAEWKDKARLIIKRIESEESLSCYSFFWQALTSSISPMDCWSPNLKGNWYGGGERLHMSWPLERSSVKLSPFVTGDEDQTEWGNVIKRYFINSLGVSLRISDETPLSISLDPDSGLCLKAHYDEFPYYYHKKGYPQLNYTVCTHENLMHLYSSQLTSSFWDGHKESDLKELRRLLKLPLWQLPPAKDGQPLDMNYVSNYIKGILGRSASITRGESRGYLLIDSSWQQNMGDLLLSERLRDLEHTVSNSGLTLVLTLTPFVSTDSTSFNEGLEKGLFVMERKLNITRDIPALTWYKNVPAAALLDITNNQTVSWIKSRLRDVVSAMPSVVFFVETGNAFHTPHYFQFEEALYNPDLYKDLFISVAMTEIKVIGVSGASSKRPKAPAFVHLTPLASNWDSLRTIIPNVLNLGVIGYPFVSTGPVGGDIHKIGTNQTTRTSSNEIVPESELFIRWWQLATFMPQIHFTVPPTQYRNKHMPTVAANLKFIKEEVVNPELIRFSQIAMENSAPVIRPLWMLHSNDSVAQTINDEFLIGDKILVAPVLDQGSYKRNVYLPRSNSGSGVWKRGTDGTFFEGGQWLNDSLAPLETVLYFIRQPDFARPDSNLS